MSYTVKIQYLFLEERLFQKIRIFHTAGLEFLVSVFKFSEREKHNNWHDKYDSLNFRVFLLTQWGIVIIELLVVKKQLKVLSRKIELTIIIEF